MEWVLMLAVAGVAGLVGVGILTARDVFARRWDHTMTARRNEGFARRQAKQQALVAMLLEQRGPRVQPADPPGYEPLPPADTLEGEVARRRLDRMLLRGIVRR